MEAGPGWARCGLGVAWAAPGPLAQQAERHLLGQAVAEGRPSVCSTGVPAVSTPRVLASPFLRQCQCLACGRRTSSPGQEGSKKAAMSQGGPGRGSVARPRPELLYQLHVPKLQGS